MTTYDERKPPENTEDHDHENPDTATDLEGEPYDPDEDIRTVEPSDPHNM